MPWLGKIPAHWDLTVLGAVLKERGEKNDKEKITKVLSLLKGRGVIPYHEKGNVGNKKSEDISRYKVVRPNDIVLNSMNVIIGSVGLSKYTGCLSPVYYVLTRRDKRHVPKYLNSYFQTKPFQRSLTRIGKGIMAHRMRIPMELLKRELFPIPPLNEQLQITRFLDWQNARINKFIRNKRKLIELLKEKKQSLINRAVTRGLEPKVKLKASGVEGLGDIPEHWQIRRLCTLASVQASGVDKHSKVDEIPVKLCNYVEVYHHDYITSKLPFMQATATPEEIKKMQIKVDDVIITKDSEAYNDIAVAAFVLEELPNIICAYHLSIIRPLPSKVRGEFLFRAFSCTLIAHQFHIAAKGVTRFGLTQGAIKGAFFPLPPKQEQESIVTYISEKSAKIMRAVARAEREIELMQEYRTRLISDVVTGKLDVRNIAVPELSEKELSDIEDSKEAAKMMEMEGANDENDGY